MTKIDRFLIERVFEPVSWRLARWLGVTATGVARFLWVVWIAGWAAHAWRTGVVHDVIFVILVVLVTPVRMWALSMIDRALDRHGANPEKHNTLDTFFRVLLGTVNVCAAFLCLISGEVTPREVSNFSFILHAYFSACDRPPPSEERQIDARLAHMGAN